MLSKSIISMNAKQGASRTSTNSFYYSKYDWKFHKRIEVLFLFQICAFYIKTKGHAEEYLAKN